MGDVLELYVAGQGFSDLRAFERAVSEAIAEDPTYGSARVTEINDQTPEFGHLVGGGRGGGTEVGFLHFIELVLAFQTTVALRAFIKAFSGRLGERVADNMFEALTPKRRAAALERERTARKGWRELLERERERAPEWLHNTPEDDANEEQRWQEWGVAADNLEYAARISIDCYVREGDTRRHLSLELQESDFRLAEEYDFVRPPTQRLRESLILEFSKFLDQINIDERGEPEKR